MVRQNGGLRREASPQQQHQGTPVLALIVLASPVLLYLFLKSLHHNARPVMSIGGCASVYYWSLTSLNEYHFLGTTVLMTSLVHS